MKRLILFLCLMMFGIANADFLGVKQASETISFFIKEPIDSAYGIPRLPDSVHIFTYADNASAATFATRSTTYPFSDISIDTLKRYGDTTYVFADQISDIDGAGGNFELAIVVKMFTNGYYLETYNTVQVISDSLENMLDASKDSSSSAAVLSKNNLDSLQAQDGWVAQEATLAYFDTLIYDGPRGPGVYLDSAAGNTNTVLGTDGTAKNPVSTIAAAKTLATALGYNRYYFINASTFNDAANDIPSSHQNWEFIGIANSNALAFGTQRVDESRFENMDLSGTMHASGGNVLYTNCTLGYITANFNGHAFNCLLADTIVVKADVDIEFVRCQSDVGGNRTPTIDLSGGSSVVQVRGYYGGIRIMNGASDDTISVETDGQVIVSANNTSLNITLRGMMSITDSGTTTNMTKDAVFSRAEADEWVWANADTTHPDSSEIGVWLVNNLSGAASGLDTLSTVFVDRLAGRMADTTWLSLLTARDGVAGSFGDSAQGWGATAASALDSAIISNILHRIVWGTAVGSGSDSSTSAQRDIGVLNSGAISSGSFVAGAINANAIASAAFTTAKFGTEFIQNTSFADRAISLSKFDSTVIALLTKGIWLDDGAANTNTTVGIDGTITKPVSTLAAARILADSQSLQQYYLINNSNFTLDATYEDWVFLGIGRGNSINFGNQDTDNSDFYNLMITGTQGGTGMVLLDLCYLNTPDSLEALVTRSSLSDTISLRVSTATVFDQCYSHIAGSDTPGLDFNSAGTIDVDVRHYSGGLTLFNGISTHTISFESDGQLVIDASCTSINVTARGNMTITDNGTTTSLTDDAVFNVNLDSVSFRTITIINTSTNDPTLYIESDSSKAIHAYTDDAGGNPAVQFEAFGGASYGLQLMGATGDLNATLNIDDLVGDFETADFEDSVFNAIKFDTDYWAELADRADSGAAATVPDSLLEVATKARSLLMNPLPGSIIPNGHLQISQNEPDSTDPAGWGALSGTGYLTTRRAFEGYSRSLYFENGSMNTLEMKLDTGYYEMAAQIWFDNATTDTAFFQCANSADDLQDWLSSGTNIEYAVGWTGWRRFARLIRLTGDSTFYFSVGANAGDSAYFAEVSLMPYGAVGHTVTASVSAGDMADIADSVWQADFEAHDGVAGSFADSAQGWGATGAAPGGSGAFSCSLFAYNSGWAPNGGSPAITSGNIRMISGVNDYTLPIDANGWAVFALDGGTWTAYITALRFLQDTIPQTITFTADHVDTLTMTAFTPGTPTDTGKVMLYVWTDSTFGATYVGATFRVIPLDKGKNWVTGGGRVLPLGELTKTTDSTGYAEIEVYQSSFTHPYPSGSDSLKYNISITYPGLSSWAQFRFVAPDSGNQYQIGVIE